VQPSPKEDGRKYRSSQEVRVRRLLRARALGRVARGVFDGHPSRETRYRECRCCRPVIACSKRCSRGQLYCRAPESSLQAQRQTCHCWSRSMDLLGTGNGAKLRMCLLVLVVQGARRPTLMVLWLRGSSCCQCGRLESRVRCLYCRFWYRLPRVRARPRNPKPKQVMGWEDDWITLRQRDSGGEMR
jgi:hypothetical protein